MTDPTFTAEQLRAEAEDLRAVGPDFQPVAAAMLEFAARLVERQQEYEEAIAVLRLTRSREVKHLRDAVGQIIDIFHFDF